MLLRNGWFFTALIFTKLVRLVSGIAGAGNILFTPSSKVLLSPHRYSQLGSTVLCGDKYVISRHIDQETLQLLVEFRSHLEV
jgi:hypothetical protein